MLGKEQAGFEKTWAVPTKFFKITNLTVPGQKKIIVTFIDYEKAFECVDHGL